jgi:hypothetical protein
MTQLGQIVQSAHPAVGQNACTTPVAAMQRPAALAAVGTSAKLGARGSSGSAAAAAPSCRLPLKASIAPSCPSSGTATLPRTTSLHQIST